MAVEVLEDIIEELANHLGVYGAHSEVCPQKKYGCRVCWVAELQRRIEAAVEVERKLCG